MRRFTTKLVKKIQQSIAFFLASYRSLNFSPADTKTRMDIIGDETWIHVNDPEEKNQFPH